MMLRRQALGTRIFDERFFMYGEDVDLCDRLKRRGWRIVFSPSIRIVHHEGRSLERQRSEVQVSKLRSLRDIYAARHGRLSLVYYDIIVSIGFLLRSLAFSTAAALRSDDALAARAGRSRLFLGEAFRSLVHRAPVRTR